MIKLLSFVLIILLLVSCESIKKNYVIHSNGVTYNVDTYNMTDNGCVIFSDKVSENKKTTVCGTFTIVETKRKKD